MHPIIMRILLQELLIKMPVLSKKYLIYRVLLVSMVAQSLARPRLLKDTSDDFSMLPIIAGFPLLGCSNNVSIELERSNNVSIEVAY